MKQKFTLIILAAIAIVLLVLLFFTGSTGESSPDSVQKTASKVLENCQNNKYFLSCYQQNFSQITKNTNVGFAKQVLGELQQKDKRVLLCHSIAHEIASAVIVKNPDQALQLLATFDPNECAGGYFHGIIESMAGLNADFNLNGEEIDKFCSVMPDDYQKGSCTHILGHIVLVETDAQIDRALDICRGVAFKKEECFSGVFMENISKANLVEHGLADAQPEWTADYALSLEEICNNYDGDIARSCRIEMGSVYATLYNNEPGPILVACQKSGKADFSNGCYLRGVVRAAIWLDSDQQIQSLCDPFDYDLPVYQDCVAKIVDALIKNSPDFLEKAVAYCSRMRSSSIQYCHRVLKFKANGMYSKDQIINLCRNFYLQDYKKLCETLTT
ncbi:MAG TPA: hypothetical protein VIK81_04800 [Patescibacteria group bacterium]